MPTYILRDLPEDLWTRFKARATAEGKPLRPLFLELIDKYASGVASKGIIVELRSSGRHVVPDAVAGEELGADLCLTNADGRRVARFDRAEVRSWYPTGRS